MALRAAVLVHELPAADTLPSGVTQVWARDIAGIPWTVAITEQEAGAHSLIHVRHDAYWIVGNTDLGIEIPGDDVRAVSRQAGSVDVVSRLDETTVRHVYCPR